MPPSTRVGPARPRRPTGTLASGPPPIREGAAAHLCEVGPGGTTQEPAMREYVWLECTACGDRNYRVQKETRGAERLELKKYCRRERKHTPHKESRKK